MSLTVLFQLTFTFIYSIFSKKNFSFNKINGSQTDPKCRFDKNYFCQLILLFSLFLLLFMGLTAFIGTIHRSHCTISINFYLYLQYFQQKFFNFSKINGFKTDSNIHFCLPHQLYEAYVCLLEVFVYYLVFYFFCFLLLYVFSLWPKNLSKLLK